MNSRYAVTTKCKDCRYFVPHYVLDKERKCFTKIDNGHCYRGRLKNRRGYDKGCDYYEIKPELYENEWRKRLEERP